MKSRMLLLAAGIAASLAFGACSTAQQQSAAQVLAKLQTDVQGGCQVFQSAEPGVQIFIAADPTVNQVVTGINLFCTANSAVTVTSLQTFVQTSIPAAEAAVNASTVIQAKDKPAVLGALSALGTAISTALVLYNQSMPAPVATGPAVTPAPAAAASAPAASQ